MHDPQLTQVVSVAFAGVQHYCDNPLSGGAHPLADFARTLCGLPAGRERVTQRAGATRLPLCPTCDGLDLARQPDRARRVLR